MLRRVVLAAMLMGGAASAQEDAEGAKEHRDIPRMPGYYVYTSELKEFDAYDFPVKVDADGNVVNESKEGRFHKVEYREKEGTEKSPLQLFRNYETAFKKSGASLVWKGTVNANEARATFRVPLGKGARWVYFNVWDQGDGYEFVILDEQEMQQELEITATEMAQRLAANGFIALYGITFETGKDAIQLESEPLLEEIVSLLKGQAGMKLSIEGHTDNVGNAKSNQTLSQKRAEAVKAWLVKKGVDARRLSTKGHGPAMPIADNRVEEGRAKNRRVELVKL